VLWVLCIPALLCAMLMLFMSVLALLLIFFVSAGSIVLNWHDSERRRVANSILSRRRMRRFHEEVAESLKGQFSNLK